MFVQSLSTFSLCISILCFLSKCYLFLKRGIDAFRIYILGLGLRAAPKARGTRSICTRNPNPVSKSTRLTQIFFSNVSAVNDHCTTTGRGHLRRHVKLPKYATPPLGLWSICPSDVIAEQCSNFCDLQLSFKLLI